MFARVVTAPPARSPPLSRLPRQRTVPGGTPAPLVFSVLGALVQEASQLQLPLVPCHLWVLAGIPSRAFPYRSQRESEEAPADGGHGRPQ